MESLHGTLEPEGFSTIPTTRGLTVISRGPKGFKRANPQRSKGIKSRTRRGGGAALSPGTDCVVPWTGGFIVDTRNEVRVIKSRTLKGEPHSALGMSVLSLDRKV